MRVSEYFGLGRTQPTLDFVDVHVDTDTSVFVDPSAIRGLETTWGTECRSLLQYFFQHVLNLISAGEDEQAMALLAALRERNEFHLGFSVGKSQGRGFGSGHAADVWKALTKSKAAKTGLLQDLEDTCLLIEGSYGDYPSTSFRAGSEQLTYLLFLKMADERSRPPYLSPNGGNQASPVLAGYDWPSLVKKDGDELFDHYRHTLEELGKQKGLLGLIFTKSQNKFQDPAKLRRLIVDLIENGVSVQANVSSANVKARSAGRSYKETWVSMSADVKGDAYEGLLKKNATLIKTMDTQSGAGQYFTPHRLIQTGA